MFPFASKKKMSLTKPASRTVLLLFFVVLVGCVAHVHGWGSLGHRTVAQLAYDRLAPQAKAVLRPPPPPPLTYTYDVHRLLVRGWAI